MNQNQMLEKYAQLLISSGLNLQPGQPLVIYALVECAPFVRLLTKTAYDKGASEVVVRWDDEEVSKARLLWAAEEVLETMPEWEVSFVREYDERGAAFLSISANNPELLKDVNSARIAKMQKTRAVGLKKHRERLMQNQNVWNVAPYATTAWAAKVFPELNQDDAVAKLWEAIFMAIRLQEENPLEAWKKHTQQLKKHMAFLNSRKFSKLRMTNSLGTDITLELPEGHIWLGGSEESQEGVEFIANIPTEEIFTLPKKCGVNGRVVSSKPLVYNGNVIDRFSLTFKDGRVIEHTAEFGSDVLETLLNLDDGARYLGEIALVSHSSPISQSGILFYNTLFDENASCHLALGKAYPVCVENSSQMTEEELAGCGVNDSLTHVDFMIGTADMNVEGITQDGEGIVFFRAGEFVNGL